MAKTLAKFDYKGLTKDAVIAKLQAMAGDTPLEVTTPTGETRETTAAEELVIAQAMPALNNNFKVGGDDAPARIVVPASTAPVEKQVECIINEVSPIQVSRRNGREYHMVTYTTVGENPITEARAVNASFLSHRNNRDKFQPQNRVILTIQETVDGKTQFIDNRLNPPALAFHTNTGESVSSITWAADNFINRAKSVASILIEHEGKPDIVKALATVFAGQKLV